MLHIDIETYSEFPIEFGVFNYVNHPSFEILIIAYALDDSPVKVLTPNDTKEMAIFKRLFDADIKAAHNSSFERLCFNAIGWESKPSDWFCTATQARYNGLPGSLDNATKALGTANQKDSKGKALIKLFSLPDENGKRTYPDDDPMRFEEFKDYCAQDVEAERDLYISLAPYPESVAKAYALDQKINDRGAFVDVDFCKKAATIAQQHVESLLSEFKELTGLPNPNSRTQLIKWVEEKTGEKLDSTAKDSLPASIERFGQGSEVAKALELKSQIARNSILTKYATAIQAANLNDSRARGLLQFYGASRTGRYAGRIIQIQNLTRNHSNLEALRGFILNEDPQGLEMYHGDVMDALSQCVRGIFRAPKGKKLISCDFSAIEARVLAWLAGEKWKLEVFRTHGKIYEATAAKIFGVPFESIGKGSELRQRGKVAELALGYEGSVGAMLQMGGDKLNLSEGEMKSIITAYRKANPAIVAFWRALEKAFRDAILTKREVKVNRYISIRYLGDWVAIKLPSGRDLMYYKAQLSNGSIRYLGDTIKGFQRIDTYGGKICENVVQAVSADILNNAIRIVDKKVTNFDTTFHVHDELVGEVDENKAQDTLIMLSKAMCELPDWADDLLPLKAEGEILDYYKK